MTHTQMTTPGQSPLHMQWVEVRDELGRSRMEARWVTDATAAALHASHAA